MNDRLDTVERRDLPDSVYGLPERREYPMPDAAHVRAWKNRSRLGQCAGADWDTFDAAKLMIFSETVAF